MDRFSKEKRSSIMSKISGKETKPEILVRKYLFSKGFRFRKNVKTILGKPDIVLSKYKTVIFIHGCFWHGHTCKRAALPKTNHEFWETKIDRNKKRDKLTKRALQEAGWNVITIWQCKIGNEVSKNIYLDKLVRKLWTLEIQ
jgi:DNA mismatch endonuclease (patch repair protein)